MIIPPPNASMTQETMKGLAVELVMRAGYKIQFVGSSAHMSADRPFASAWARGTDGKALYAVRVYADGTHKVIAGITRRAR